LHTGDWSDPDRYGDFYRDAIAYGYSYSYVYSDPDAYMFPASAFWANLLGRFNDGN